MVEEQWWLVWLDCPLACLLMNLDACDEPRQVLPLKAGQLGRG